MAKFPIFLCELAEDDRKHINHCIKVLLGWLRSCEGRLRGYESEDAEAESQSVIKLLQDLKTTLVMIDEMKNELVEKHRLPDELKRIDDEFRRTFRNVLIGVPLD